VHFISSFMQHREQSSMHSSNNSIFSNHEH
jgi:hypothetical protein